MGGNSVKLKKIAIIRIPFPRSCDGCRLFSIDGCLTPVCGAISAYEQSEYFDKMSEEAWEEWYENFDSARDRLPICPIKKGRRRLWQ